MTCQICFSEMTRLQGCFCKKCGSNDTCHSCADKVSMKCSFCNAENSLVKIGNPIFESKKCKCCDFTSFKRRDGNSPGEYKWKELHFCNTCSKYSCNECTKRCNNCGDNVCKKCESKCEKIIKRGMENQRLGDWMCSFLSINKHFNKDVSEWYNTYIDQLERLDGELSTFSLRKVHYCECVGDGIAYYQRQLGFLVRFLYEDYKHMLGTHLDSISTHKYNEIRKKIFDSSVL